MKSRRRFVTKDILSDPVRRRELIRGAVSFLTAIADEEPHTIPPDTAEGIRELDRIVQEAPTRLTIGEWTPVQVAEMARKGRDAALGRIRDLETLLVRLQAVEPGTPGGPEALNSVGILAHAVWGAEAREHLLSPENESLALLEAAADLIQELRADNTELKKALGRPEA